jgi:ABC-type multidrug transport system ATPase subunit
MVNGYPKVQKTFTHVEGYVEDLSSYAPYMTIRENIEFSVALQLGKKFVFEKCKDFVEEVSNKDIYLF